MTQLESPPMPSKQAAPPKQGEAAEAGSAEVSTPRPLRWTREMYERALDAGVLEGKRVERIDGEIIEMPAQKHPHAWSLGMTDDWLRRVFADGFHVRAQMPMKVDAASDPEPDLAVIRGSRRETTEHPTTAVLVIEVSEATVAHDRRKARRYARAGVEDYWILNLPDRTLEVHRGPIDDAKEDSPAYRSVQVLAEDAEIAPLAAPEAKVRVRDLLP